MLNVRRSINRFVATVCERDQLDWVDAKMREFPQIVLRGAEPFYDNAAEL